MTSNTDNHAGDWDKYWSGSQHTPAYSTEGVNHPLIDEFWRGYFSAVVEEFDSPRIVDIACGNGALIEAAREAFAGREARLECLDISEHAIHSVTRRFPEVVGHVANASDPGLERGAYSIVASQFGIEYAGVAAIDKLHELVAPRGQLALMLHHSGGSIFEECRNNLEAATEILESGYIDLAISMFNTGYATLRGEASVEDYNNATRGVIPAMRRLEAVAGRFGPDIAGGTLARLYNEVGNIQEDLKHYDGEEVVDWLGRTRDEVEGYTGRMQSMCDAAVDSETFDTLVAGLRDRAFDVRDAGVIAASGKPLAWTLVATRINA